ncbi:hypothetical protein STEG23_021868 [Scotinomys teguina]
MVGRVQPDRKQLPLVLLRLLCLLPTGLPVRSVDFNRGTDNITVRQGDTAILRSAKLYNMIWDGNLEKHPKSLRVDPSKLCKPNGEPPD